MSSSLVSEEFNNYTLIYLLRAEIWELTARFYLQNSVINFRTCHWFGYFKAVVNIRWHLAEFMYGTILKRKTSKFRERQKRIMCLLEQQRLSPPDIYENILTPLLIIIKCYCSFLHILKYCTKYVILMMNFQTSWEGLKPE